MSLRDYIVTDTDLRDWFEAKVTEESEDERGFPCTACECGDKKHCDSPCNKCCHNIYLRAEE